MLRYFAFVVPVLVSSFACAAGAAAEPTGYQLANGLTVLLRPVRGARETALVVLFSVGGDHDPKGRSGLAHMLEHVYVTAAAGAEKARRVEEYIQRYPSGWNAQTGDRYTVIASVFPEKDLDRELRDAAVRMGDLRVTAADLDREKPRVLSELDNMYRRIPSLAALNNAREMVRPTPLGGRKGGVPEHVRAVTIEEIQERWRRYYKPRNALVAIAGAVDVAAARKAIAAHFGKLPAGEAIPDAQEPGKPTLGRTRAIATKPLAGDATSEICLAYAAPAPTNDVFPAYLVLAARMQARAGKLGADASRFPVYCPLLDDPTVLYLHTPAKTGETAAQAETRLRAFVADAVAPPLDAGDIAAVSALFGPMLGISEAADAVLTNNPYFVAFATGRRRQLGIDGAKLKATLAKLRDEDLRRAARKVFGSGRHAGVFVSETEK